MATGMGLNEAERLQALRRHGILDTPAEATFDRIVEIVRLACDVPIALVSLVDADRQWFKARVGVDLDETPRDTSVCDFVVRQAGALEISDLAQDPRTAAMSLVAGEAHLRFYAGAPLIDSQGAVLGSLCAIDLVPRPEGLSGDQRRILETLAAEVVSAIELRSAVDRRDRALVADGQLLRARQAQQVAEARLKDSEARYRTLFDTMDEGFCVLRFIDGPHGPLSDYVHVEANAALEQHLGVADIVGRSLREMLPQEDAEGWLAIYRQVLDTGRSVRFERRFAPTDRDLEVACHRLEPAGRPEVAVLFTDVTERRTAREALQASEARWRGLFQALQEGFVLGEPVRDAAGVITDWRYLQVNAAWSELVGVDAASVIGRTIREILPDVEQEWVDLAKVVDGGGSIYFARQVDQLDRWYEGRASAVGPDTFTLLFMEVTDRVRANQALAESSARKAALAELADCLRTARDARAMAHVTASIIGRTLGACRAGYGSVDARRETIEVSSDWSSPAVASIAGEHRFRAFGSYIEDLLKGRLVAVSDVRTDPRTAAGAAAWEALGVRALVNAPVLEKGELVAVCFVHWAEPHVASVEDQGFVRSAADRAQVGVARLRADERQALLNGEINHRLKNTLAMVQGMATQTLRRATDPEALAAFEARLIAFSTAHDVLFQSEWRSAELRVIVEQVLGAAGAEGRFDAEGPPVQLGARAALSASLLLHELTTNAQKHGALSRAGGRVEVRWGWSEAGDDADLLLRWVEVGGPPATPPARAGFGSRLLRLGLIGSGGAELKFGGDGFSASFRGSKRQVEDAP